VGTHFLERLRKFLGLVAHKTDLHDFPPFAYVFGYVLHIMFEKNAVFML